MGKRGLTWAGKYYLGKNRCDKIMATEEEVREARELELAEEKYYTCIEDQKPNPQTFKLYARTSLVREIILAACNFGVKKTECGHMFHGMCIFRWLQSNRHHLCPLCRFPLLHPFRRDFMKSPLSQRLQWMHHAIYFADFPSLLRSSVTDFPLISWRLMSMKVVDLVQSQRISWTLTRTVA